MQNSVSNTPSNRPGSGLKTMAKKALLGVLAATNIGCGEKTAVEKCIAKAGDVESTVKNVHDQLRTDKIWGWAYPGGGPDLDDARTSLLEADQLMKEIVDPDPTLSSDCLTEDDRKDLQQKVIAARKAVNEFND